MMKQRKNIFKIFLRLYKLAKPIWGWLLLSILINAVLIGCNVASPQMLGDLVQQLYDFWAGEFTGESLLDTVIAGIIPLGIVYLTVSLLSYAKMYLLNNVVTRHYTNAIRKAISEKLKSLPVKFFDCTPVGEVLRNLMDDVSGMGTSIHITVDDLLSLFFQMVIIITVMFFENWQLAIVVLLVTPLSLFFSSKLSTKCEKHFDEMFKQSGKLNSLVEESYSNYATTKAYNHEAKTIRLHKEINDCQREHENKANFFAVIIRPCLVFIDALVYIVINLVGGFLITKDLASVGTIVTMVLFAKQISAPLENVADLLGEVQRAASSSERVFKLLDSVPEIPNTGSFGDKEVLGDVKFEDINFSYDPSKPLIKNLSLDIKHGQNIAIVGPTGAGKTTIVNLLMRFYDPQSGKITVDGRDIAEISRDEVRVLFGMVLQDTWLFGGTVAENVAYGKPNATREEIIEACDEAYCDHFIRTLPQGYDTVIGDDTTNISGGQKQLLTIARALLANHRLLILDEATSNVDTRTEILIQKAMDKLMSGKTCFVIAHRLSTIVDSDLILVINDGQIIETGKHEELLAKKGFYYEMYNSQYAV